MENTYGQSGANFQPQVPLPGASNVYTLGIISIVGAFCCGLVGIICGIIGLVTANKNLALYQSEPDKYTSESVSKLNSGRTCSIVGLCIAGAMMIVGIIYYIVVGSAAFYGRFGGRGF